MIHMTNPSLVAVATGIVGSAWTSGAIACFSLVAAPAALTIPETAARNWAELYRRGAASMPKFAATSALAYLYSAYSTHSLGGSWQGFAAAAVATLSIVPWTILVMAPTNNTLHRVARAEEKRSDHEVAELVGHWNLLNSVRSLLPLVGTLIGAWTLHQNILL